MDGIEPDLGGWGPKSWDLLERSIATLEKRIDAIRADLNLLMGKPHDGDPPEGKRIGGISITTWIALLATVVVPLVGTAALVVTHNP